MSDFDFGFTPPENPMDEYGPIDEEDLLKQTMGSNFDDIEDQLEEQLQELDEDLEKDKNRTLNNKKNKTNQRKSTQKEDSKKNQNFNKKQNLDKNKSLDKTKPLYEQLIDTKEDVKNNKQDDKNKDIKEDENKNFDKSKDEIENKDIKKENKQANNKNKSQVEKDRNRKNKLKDMLKETTLVEETSRDNPENSKKVVLESLDETLGEIDGVDIETSKNEDKEVIDVVLESVLEEGGKEKDNVSKEVDDNNKDNNNEDNDNYEEIEDPVKNKENTLVEKDKYKSEVIDDIRKQFEEEQRKNKEYVEEELEKREHKSPPPIENKFLSNLIVNLEELFQNVRFYKMSQTTMYDKTLKEGLSFVDIILHFITSMMLGTGVMKLIESYRMFGNINGKVVSSYKRSMYGFFAFFFIVPVLKLLLIGIFGTLMNKRRDTERDSYKDIFYHIIISSYAIIIPAIAFKLFVDINPQIAILIMIPIIYLESSNLRNIINVSEILGIQTSFSVEFLSFITVYFLMLFTIIKYFYL